MTLACPDCGVRFTRAPASAACPRCDGPLLRLDSAAQALGLPLHAEGDAGLRALELAIASVRPPLAPRA